MLSIRTILYLLRFIHLPWFWVSVKHINEDMTSITVQMKMFLESKLCRHAFWWSLYSMCDPWYMFILLEHLGKECVVWDKVAEIDFVAPGKGTVYATFEIDRSTIEQLREQVRTTKSISQSFRRRSRMTLEIRLRRLKRLCMFDANVRKRNL